MMINPLWALIGSILGVILLLRLKLHPGFAIFGGALVLSLLSMPFSATPGILFDAFWDFDMLRLAVIMTTALMLSELMAEKGMLTRLAISLSVVNPKLAAVLIPAIVGFVPMPAGAVVSAAASNDLFRQIGTPPEQNTFLNYWFRHFWEHSMPMYPAVITAGIIIAIPFSDIFLWLLPGTALAVIIGCVASFLILRRYPAVRGTPTGGKTVILNSFRAAWPIVVLVAAILLGLDAVFAFPVTLVLVGLQQRAHLSDWKKAFAYGFEFKIIFMLYAVMLYKAVVETCDAADAVYTGMQAAGLPIVLVLMVVPLIIGFITAFGTAFVGILLPLFLPMILTDSGLNGAALWLVYGSGMMGMMLSPLHLCLMMSTEYFKAKFSKIYPYLLPCCLVFEAVLVLTYLVAG